MVGIFIHSHLDFYIYKSKPKNYKPKTTPTIPLVHSFLYMIGWDLHLYIHIIKCKQVPTLKFGA